MKNNHDNEDKKQQNPGEKAGKPSIDEMIAQQQPQDKTPSEILWDRIRKSRIYKTGSL
ncbi:MAG: hypothetical protein ACLFR1_05420 [Spirochaetia bacterium]